MDDYEPFPEIELRHYAAMTPVAKLRETIYSAIKSHDALRERCLLAEMDRNHLLLKLEAKGAA